jgi:hypothetical protein
MSARVTGGKHPLLEEIFGGLKGGVRLRGTDGKVKLDTNPNLMEPLKCMRM